MRRIMISLLALFSHGIFAADVPGGMLRDAEGLPSRNFEVVLAPEYIFSAKAMYLTSELRYQLNEDVGFGAAFGSGELGFHLGGYANWFLIPDLETQPAVSILGGMYVNKVNGSDYFVLTISPTVSKRFTTRWGGLTPYWGLSFAPSFSLAQAPNAFSVRSSIGTQVQINALQGMRLWAELGLGLVKSYDQLSLALSYPFKGL